MVVHSSQLAQQERKTSAKAQGKEAERVAIHVRQTTAQQLARAADAEAAIAAYAGHGRGRRGRTPQPWRSHAPDYRVERFRQGKKRPRRGRPPKAEAPPSQVLYRLAVAVRPLECAEDEHGWTVLATTVGPEVCADTEILQAYHTQNTTVEPGFRWIKNPAAISPVWLEKPERIAALAMLTVLGLLVYAVIQRQVRLSLRQQDHQLPGNKGPTATPTAAVVLALFTPVTMVHFQVGPTDVLHVEIGRAHV